MAFGFSATSRTFALVAATALISAAGLGGHVQAAAPAWTLTPVLRDGVEQPQCPSAAFFQVPGQLNYFFGRTTAIADRAQCHTATPYTLALFKMDWTRSNLAFVHPLLMVPTTTPRGIHITNALDPTSVTYKGETWVAFECSADLQDNSSCVAPIDPSTGMLNLARLSVPVRGVKETSSDIRHSASDPKLYVHNGNIYLYWTVVEHSPGQGFINLTARGTQLTEVGGQLTPQGAPGRAIASIDPGNSAQVMHLRPTDRTANVAADIYDVRTIGGRTLVAAATGGTGAGNGEEKCSDQTKHSSGCYHLEILQGSGDLGENVFSTRIAGGHDLPYNPVGYTHFITKPDGSTAILGQFLPPVVRSPGYEYVKAGWAILSLPGL